MSLTQIFTAIAYGGSAFIVSRDNRADPMAITGLMESEKITFTGATPTEYMNWIRYGSLGSLQKTPWNRAISGGEQVTDVFMRELRNIGKNGLRVFNAYGPTEVTCSCTKMELVYDDNINNKNSSRISAGFPSPNASVYIVDNDMKPVPIGVPGEILVGGPGIALGYLDNEGLTSQRFVPNSFSTAEAHRTLHKTGDKGRWRSDGSIVINGRVDGDTQVKLRGLRIDLQDVETAIIRCANSQVAEAVVTLRSIPTSALQVLVAHITFSPDCPTEGQARVIETLPSQIDLPQYMVPSVIIPLDKMPSTNSSKLDRRAIANLPLPRSLASTTDDAPLDVFESQLKAIWEQIIPGDILSHHALDANSDFFLVGGNSLLLVRLQALIQTSFSIKLPLVQLFESSTLRKMSSRIQSLSNAPQVSIDWENETQVPADIIELSKTSSPRTHKVTHKEIILTGSTGFLGKEILRQLINDDRVSKIYCIGIRQKVVTDPLFGSPKVKLYYGDLTLPAVGLSSSEATEIFNSADAVIHNAAEVSHLKNYDTLRQANVGSTIELFRLALPHQIPFHYVSTAGVALLSGENVFEEVTAAPYLPPRDGSDGYTASKWASERFLEKANLACHLPVRIHRPSNIAREDFPDFDLLQNLLKYSRLMHAVPLSPKLQGVFDLVTLDHCASDIVCEVCNTEQAAIHNVKYLNLSGDVNIPLQGLKDYLDQEDGGDYSMLSITEWASKAKDMGMETVVAAFYESVESAPGTVTFPRLVKNRLGEVV